VPQLQERSSEYRLCNDSQSVQTARRRPRLAAVELVRLHTTTHLVLAAQAGQTPLLLQLAVLLPAAALPLQLRAAAAAVAAPAAAAPAAAHAQMGPSDGLVHASALRSGASASRPTAAVDATLPLNTSQQSSCVQHDAHAATQRRQLRVLLVCRPLQQPNCTYQTLCGSTSTAPAAVRLSAQLSTEYALI
jgi:hypothetical protein